MNRIGFLLGLGAALTMSAGPALSQARPPSQRTGPITIYGPGSTGDGSLFTARPDEAAPADTLAKHLSKMGPLRQNPYGPGAYPAWAQGLGSQYGGFTSYYDIKPLATNGLYVPNGGGTIYNPFTYGGLNTSGGLTVSVNVPRPGCAQGFTDPNQSATYDEFGAYSICAQVDSTPLMATAFGSFSANAFTPSSPIALSSTVRIGVGMWIRTNDAPAQFNGQITSWNTATQTNVTDPAATVGAVTQINVSGWFKRGAGGGASTPTGSIAYINPRDKIWGLLNTPFQNGILIHGTLTAGSTGIPVDSVDGLYANSGQLVEGTGIPDNAVIAGIDYGNKIIYITNAPTLSGPVTITVSAGTEMGKFVGEELDLFNAGVAFKPQWVQDTGATTAGSYTITGITVISQWRPGLVVYGAGVPTGAVVTSVNSANNSITIKQPATATASGVALKAQNQLEEGGTGIDCLGVVKNTNTCFLQRGSVSYGFLSMGAGDTSFLVRPDVFAALPKYAFRTDGRINGHSLIADFAVTNHDTVLWSVDGAGNVVEAVSAPPPSGTSPCKFGARAWDGTSEYRCVGTNKWRRAALVDF